MPPAEVVTTEMVHAITPCTEARAQHIATYLNHRYAGLYKVDACRETSISQSSGALFEKWLPALQERFGLPELPAQDTAERPRDKRAASLRGTHQTNHVGRSVTDPECDLCQIAEGATT